MRVWSDGRYEVTGPTLAELLLQQTPPTPVATAATVQPLALTAAEIESLRRQELLRVAKENKEAYQIYRVLRQLAKADGVMWDEKEPWVDCVS